MLHVTQVCHAASDEVLVTGGYDTAVKVWDCRSWNQEPIQTMRQCKVCWLTAVCTLLCWMLV
jgi:hypothetical protein